MMPTMYVRMVHALVQFLLIVYFKEKSPSGRYILLARQVYELINASATYQFAAVLLNSRLFQQMGANALLFLAGVFTSPDAPDAVKRVALQHACAYLRAHSKSSGAPCDFQTIIPSYLHVLQSRDAPLRSAATECLEILDQIMKAEKPSSIYGLDKVYGPASCRSSSRIFCLVLN